MKLQFDANQDFQLDAINTAVDLFKGQPYAEIIFGNGEMAEKFPLIAIISKRCLIS